MYGYNIDGGGNANKSISKETKNKMSINNARYWKDKKLPSAICKKMSKKKIGNNNPQFGKLGKLNKMSKPVLQYDLKGNFIQSFDGINEAYRKTTIKAPNISNCILGKRKTAGGFVWKSGSDN